LKQPLPDAQPMNVCAGFHHGPDSAGMARHFAPFSCCHTMPAIRWRRLPIGTLQGGRHAAINGSRNNHSSSVIPSHTAVPETPENSSNGKEFSG
jgi:hypothetical protein